MNKKNRSNESPSRYFKSCEGEGINKHFIKSRDLSRHLIKRASEFEVDTRDKTRCSIASLRRRREGKWENVKDAQDANDETTAVDTRETSGL